MAKALQTIRSVAAALVILVLSCASAAAGIGCNGCHGTSNPVDYRPLDDASRNPVTGGFRGNHRPHVGSPLAIQACAKCHPDSSAYTSHHRDGLIKLTSNINRSNLPALYRNSTSAFPQTATPQLGTCTNVNCHFERDTPTWGDPVPAYPAGCGICHGAPPTGGEGGAAGSHARHELFFPGVGNCQACHKDHTSFGHATSAGRPLVVRPRYPAATPAGTYDGPVTDYFPKSQTNLFGTCSTFYCHSDGTSVASGVVTPFTTPAWGGAALSCTACHSYPPSYANGTPKKNSHQAHGAFGCPQCHSLTTLNGATIISPGKHINGAFDVAPGIGGMLNYAFAPSGGTCSNISCHFDGSATWGGTLACLDCHGSVRQPPHFNDITTATYPAAYVTTNISCPACHTRHGDTINRNVRLQWGDTGKGSVSSPAWTAQNFKAMGTPVPASPATSFAARDCVRCHTTTGYVNYVTDAVGDGLSAFRNIAAWGGPSDKTKEVLACNACHVSAIDPSQTFDDASSRRVVGNYLTGVNAQAWYSYSSAGGKSRIQKTFNDEGDSNLCLPCHSGTTAGNNLKKLPAGFNWSSVDFIDPHGTAAAGILFPGFGTTAAERVMTIGYEFSGRSYGNAASHTGLDASDGPCVQCHMTYSPDKHRFSPVSTASNGVIQRITSARCADCHGLGASIALDTGGKLEAKRQRFLAALAVIEELFRTKRGIYFRGDKFPYFFTDGTYTAKVTNWGNANVMGAAFNLKLFRSEKGAYVHNALHVQQLLYDTADFLDDGVQNNSVASIIQNLSIDPSTRSIALGYLGTRWLAVPPSP